MFEVQDLKFATLATVSRCGMVWFSEDVLTLDMVFENFLSRLREISIDDAEDDRSRFASSREKKADTLSPTMQVALTDRALSCRHPCCFFFSLLSSGAEGLCGSSGTPLSLRWLDAAMPSTCRDLGPHHGLHPVEGAKLPDLYASPNGP